VASPTPVANTLGCSHLQEHRVRSVPLHVADALASLVVRAVASARDVWRCAVILVMSLILEQTLVPRLILAPILPAVAPRSNCAVARSRRIRIPSFCTRHGRCRASPCRLALRGRAPLAHAFEPALTAQERYVGGSAGEGVVLGGVGGWGGGGAGRRASPCHQVQRERAPPAHAF
jgi:hypothetical protein